MSEISPALLGSIMGRFLFVPRIVPIGVKFLSIQKAKIEHKYHSNSKLEGESRVSFKVATRPCFALSAVVFGPSSG